MDMFVVRRVQEAMLSQPTIGNVYFGLKPMVATSFSTFILAFGHIHDTFFEIESERCTG
jgi:hypothetical protein